MQIKNVRNSFLAAISSQAPLRSILVSNPPLLFILGWKFSFVFSAEASAEGKCEIINIWMRFGPIWDFNYRTFTNFTRSQVFLVAE